MHREEGKWTDEDGSGRELGDEFGDAEAARCRAGNVEGESEGRQDNLNWEVQYVDDVLAVTVAENLVPNTHELFHRLHQSFSRTRHGYPNTHAHSLRVSEWRRR